MGPGETGRIVQGEVMSVYNNLVNSKHENVTWFLPSCFFWLFFGYLCVWLGFCLLVLFFHFLDRI